MYIAILEDDARRASAMLALLAAECPEHQPLVFDAAPPMVAWLSEHLSETALLCLDHDLGPSRLIEGVRTEPGTGRDVADCLCRHTAVCPVLVHTSNSYARPGMVGALTESGWRVESVVPFDDLGWLEAAWMPALRTLLGLASGG